MTFKINIKHRNQTETGDWFGCTKHNRSQFLMSLLFLSLNQKEELKEYIIWSTNRYTI